MTRNETLKSELIETAGVWRFVTWRRYRRRDGTIVQWHSRQHRKALPTARARKVLTARALLKRSLWLPGQLNWRIGLVFSAGSLLFLAGSVLCLVPQLAEALSLSGTEVNAVFFLGSIPFSIAAYMQLYQAANAGEFLPGREAIRRRVTVFGWRPHDAGWLSCALQFIGTLLFNVNTFDAMLPGLDWLQQDLVIWVPDAAGSVLFLASGYLAFVETCHAHWRWKPRDLSWWTAFVNFLGCIAFMISAVFAFVPSQPFGFDAATVSVAFTLLGALGFLGGSLLMLPETAAAPKDSEEEERLHD